MISKLVELGNLIFSVYSKVWDWLFTTYEVNLGINLGSLDIFYSPIPGLQYLHYLLPDSTISFAPVDVLVSGIVVFMGYRIVKWFTDLLL